MNADERRLIDETLQGRTEAFGELVARYQNALYNSILRVLSHPDDSLEVLQETFLHAYQALGSFKGDSEFYTWLYRIAFNQAISLKRRQRKFRGMIRFPMTGEEGPEFADRSQHPSPTASLEREENDRALQQAMAKLSTEHRIILTLKDIEDLRYEQIAEILDIAVGTVRSRLHRARAELRQLLTPECEPPVAAMTVTQETPSAKRGESVAAQASGRGKHRQAEPATDPRRSESSLGTRREPT